jgi:hypothetical protein
MSPDLPNFPFIDILDVAKALGLRVKSSRLKDFRCNAVWRGGDSFRIRLCSPARYLVPGPKCGSWYDTKTGEAGGVVTFVMKVLDCDELTARLWLVQFAASDLNSIRGVAA